MEDVVVDCKMNTRYYYILDLILKHITIAFAIFTVFVHLSKWIQVPFIFVVYGTLIICGTVFCLFRKSIKKQSNLYSNKHDEAEKNHLRFFYEAVKNGSPFVLLVSLALLSGVITGSINAPEEDDSAYVSPIVQNINNPEMPLSRNNDWIVPWNSGEKLTSEFNNISHSYEYFIGVISYLTGVQYLYIYQMAGSLIWGAVFFIVYFYLLSRFVNEKAALFASFSIVLACLFVFREGGLGFGIYLNKIWIGKVILQVIMPPLIAAFAFDFIQKPNKNNWFLVFFACVAATGFSTSSLFIVPSLLSVLALGSLLWGEKSRNYRIIVYAFALFTTALYPLVIGVVHYLSMSKNVTAGMSTLLGYKGHLLFSSAYHNWLGKYSSVSSLMILISIVYLLFIYKKEYLFIMGWFLFSMLIFVNPFTEDFVASHLTSHLTYSRIFFIVPWFALLGLALGNAFERYSKYIRFTVKSLGFTTILLVLIASVSYALGRNTIKIDFDVPKNNTLGAPSFGIPSRKIDIDLVKDISAISKILPSGNTLATIDYGIAIPMFTDKYPMYYPWPPDTLKFFGKISGHEDEANLRLGALAFLQGNWGSKIDFDKLINSPVKNLVISRKYVIDMPALEKTVSLNGFVLLEKTNRYVLFTRPYGAGNTAITSTDALTLSAGGTNQNVTLTPSGTGYTVINGNVGIGTNSPAVTGNYTTLTTNGPFGGMVQYQFNGTNAGIIYGNAGALNLDTQAVKPVLFFINGVEKARVDSNGLKVTGTVTFGGTNSTGRGGALLGSNSPAITLTAPYTWITVIAADGSTVYIPAWK